MPERRSPDPVGAGNFEVEIDGQPIGLASVSGLGLNVAPSDAAPAGSIGPIALRRGITGDPAFITLARRALTKRFAPATVRITLLDAVRRPVCTWELRGARPVKWEGPELDASSSAVAMESLVISAESLTFERAPVRGRRR